MGLTLWEADVQIKITNQRVLDFFNFKVILPRGCVSVEQPLSLWLRCLWWKYVKAPI